MDFHKTLNLYYTTKNAPCYGNHHKKNASLSAIARDISITTIYTIGCLQIFNAGHFFSSMHCHDLQRKKHCIAMVFNETTNYDYILLSK